MPPSDTHAGSEVFEILVREHADMLSAYLRSVVRRADRVDDLFQETMLVAWRRLADYDKNRSFGAWLRGIASNLVLREHRKAARDFRRCDARVLEALDDRFHTLERQPGDAFRERAKRIRSCIERLPELLGSVVELAYARGLMIKQIAMALEASEEAVKKRLQRGRQMLADCILDRAT